MKARETWKHVSASYDSHIKNFSADLAFYAHEAASYVARAWR